jgi:hypothetical protein
MKKQQRLIAIPSAILGKLLSELMGFPDVPSGAKLFRHLNPTDAKGTENLWAPMETQWAPMDSMGTHSWGTVSSEWPIWGRQV